MSVLFAMLAGLCQVASAQETATVLGRVNDADGRPLRDVLVFLDDGQPYTRTDSLGTFQLTEVTRAAHRLSYRGRGYAPRSFSLELQPGDDLLDVGGMVMRPGPEPTATLSGTVTEGNGGPGLAGATVELNGRVIAITDSLGAFEVPGSPVAWGSNDISIRHQAFSDRTASDRVWVANPNETFDLVVALDIVPVALPEVGVQVESAKLAAEGFYERREELSGAGTFFTAAEITERSPRRMEDLLPRSIAGSGLRRGPRSAVGSDPVTGAPVPAATFGLAEEGQPCRPVFYLNGLRVGEVDAPAGVGSGLDQLVQPDEVEGIEIYESVARLPPEFSPIGAVCGVILIWTH